MNGTAPNVLLVVVDEWRAQSFGYTGDPNAHTPTIDALAAESINFEQAISGTPVCCPARASFLTGEYPLDHGVYVNDVPLETSEPTLASTFRSSGYDTAYIGKWHLYGSPEGWFERREAYVPPEARLGFDTWAAGECTHDYNHSVYYEGDDPTPRVWEGYDAIAQTDAAVSYLTERSGTDPFFLMLSYGPPHFPLDSAPAKYRDLYRDRPIVLRENVPEDKREEATRDLRGYYAHMAAIDDCMADLLSTLDDLGIADNTVVVFTSDHGDMMWSQGLEYKLVPWEESIRVPFLARVPGRPSERRQALLNSPDLMPTVLGMAGIPAPGGIQGVDLLEFHGPTTALLSVPAAFSTMRWYGFEEYRGVRDARYTYVQSLAGPWLLYDNVSDPFQRINLVEHPDYAEVRGRLELELRSWLARLGDEFLPAGDYLARDGLTHYFEVNEPLGYAAESTGQWMSTSRRGRQWSVDTPIAMLAPRPDAMRLIADLAPAVLDVIGDPLSAQDSVRVVSLLHPGIVAATEFARLDEALAELGDRASSSRDRVADERASLSGHRSPAPWPTGELDAPSAPIR